MIPAMNAASEQEYTRRLSLSWDNRILPGTPFQIMTTPNCGKSAFLPHRIVWGDTPSHWIVNDVAIGQRQQLRSQFLRKPFLQFPWRARDITGQMLNEAMSHFENQRMRAYGDQQHDAAFEEIAVGEVMSITVTYAGDRRDGAPFNCIVRGSEVRAPVPTSIPTSAPMPAIAFPSAWTPPTWATTSALGQRDGRGDMSERGRDDLERRAPPRSDADRAMDAVHDRVMLRTLLVKDEFRRREDPRAWLRPMTYAQREAVSAHWSAQLRAKVADADRAERGRVLVDREVDQED